MAISLLGTYLGLCTLALLMYSIATPLTTGVQTQRRVSAWINGTPYEKQYKPVSLAYISDYLERAVVAAEDTRFYQHGGIDWNAIRKAIEERRDGESQRGGSSITQQLVKNLFMTTHGTYLRKALEVPLTYAADLILSKRRILELYLNVIEWGPGIYGAEAAAQYHYGQSARTLSRYQSAALAACIPNPLERRPEVMDWYTRIILQRMNILAGKPASEDSTTGSMHTPPASANANAAPAVTADTTSADVDPPAPQTTPPETLPPRPPDSVITDSSRIDTTTTPSQ